jgi:EAL domain-containing protein (putative c-di-GMP-specific phosphodiesterase class I)
VCGCHHDPHRRAVLESICLLARHFGSHTVAEGVDDPRDLDTIVSLGVDQAQGFLLARPQPVEEAGRGLQQLAIE